MANYAIRGLYFEPKLKAEIITDTSNSYGFTVDTTGWWFIGGTLAKNVMKPNGDKYIKQSLAPKTENKTIYNSGSVSIAHQNGYIYGPSISIGVDGSRLIVNVTGTYSSNTANRITVYYQGGEGSTTALVGGSGRSNLSLTYLEEV